MKTTASRMSQQNAAGFAKLFSLMLFGIMFALSASFAAPGVTSVTTAHANGAFTIGEVIDITVTYNESVTVNGGVPVIDLNSNGLANYLSGSPGTVLTFRYTVAGGENSADLDYNTTSSLVLNGTTTINDTATGLVAADNTLPAVGTFAGAHAIIIDTTTPLVAIQSPANGGNISNATPALDFTASDANLDACNWTVDGGAQNGTGCLNTTLAALADGQHNVTVTVNDSAGNRASNISIFTVDVTAPVVTPNGPANNLFTSNNNITFNYTATDNIAANLNCTIYMNGAFLGNFVVANNTEDVRMYAGTADGYYTWYVNCSDNAGNWNVSATRNFTVDTTAPTVTIQSPSNTTYATSTPALSFTTVDSGSGVDSTKCVYTIDGGAAVSIGTCSNTTLPAQSDGAHTLVVYSNDSVNNRGSATVSFSVDTIAPAITLLYPTNTTYNAQQSTGNYIVSDAGTIAGCWFSMGAANVTLAACANITGQYATTDGFHTLTVFVNDTAGNMNSTRVSFITDTVAPVLVVSSPANTTYNTSTVPLNYTTSDPSSGIASCNYTLDASTVVGCGNASLASLGEGAHTVTVRAVDNAGNLNTSTVSFLVDTIAPSVSGGWVNVTYAKSSQTVWVNVTASDSGSGIASVKANGVSMALVSGSLYTVSTTGAALGCASSGACAITFVATDNAGNTNGTATASYTVDDTAPAVSVTYPLNNTIVSNSSVGQLDVQFTFSDSGSGLSICNYSYTLNGGAPISGTGICAYPALGFTNEGNYTFTITATDAVGNSNSSAVNFTYDKTAPALVSNSPANDSIANGDTKFTANYTEIHPDTCTFTLSNGTTNDSYMAPASGGNCSHTYTIAALNSIFGNGNAHSGDGVYTWWFVMNDSANNTNATEVRTITFDTTPPEITYYGPITGGVNISNASGTLRPLNFVITDIHLAGNAALSTETGLVNNSLNCTAINGSAYNCTAMLNITGLADGRYNISAWANDTAGNEGWGNITITVDSTAPQIIVGGIYSGMPNDGNNFIADRPGQQTTFANSSFTDALSGLALWNITAYYHGPGNLSWSCQGSTSGFNTCPISAQYSGDYTVVMWDLDNAGNMANATLQFRVYNGKPLLIFNNTDFNYWITAAPGLTFNPGAEAFTQRRASYTLPIPYYQIPTPGSVPMLAPAGSMISPLYISAPFFARGNTMENYAYDYVFSFSTEVGLTNSTAVFTLFTPGMVPAFKQVQKMYPIGGITNLTLYAPNRNALGGMADGYTITLDNLNSNSSTEMNMTGMEIVGGMPTGSTTMVLTGLTGNNTYTVHMVMAPQPPVGVNGQSLTGFNPALGPMPGRMYNTSYAINITAISPFYHPDNTSVEFTFPVNVTMTNTSPMLPFVNSTFYAIATGITLEADEGAGFVDVTPPCVSGPLALAHVPTCRVNCDWAQDNINGSPTYGNWFYVCLQTYTYPIANISRLDWVNGSTAKLRANATISFPIFGNTSIQPGTAGSVNYWNGTIMMASSSGLNLTSMLGIASGDAVSVVLNGRTLPPSDYAVGSLYINGEALMQGPNTIAVAYAKATPGPAGGDQFAGGGTPYNGSTNQTPQQNTTDCRTQGCATGFACMAAQGAYACEPPTAQGANLNGTTENDTGIYAVVITGIGVPPEVGGTLANDSGIPPILDNVSVYQYMQLHTNRPPANITNATIRFKVPKDWVDANHIDPNSIALYRLVGSIWTKLPTHLLADDASYYYYEAITPGFSYFAIAGPVLASAPPETCLTTGCASGYSCQNVGGAYSCMPVEKPPVSGGNGTTQPPSGGQGTQQPPAQQQGSGMGGIIAIIVLIVVVIGAAYFFMTKKEPPKASAAPEGYKFKGKKPAAGAPPA